MFAPPERQSRLTFDDFDHFAALVFAAMRTGTMRPDLLLAIGALRHLRNAQRIMRPARRGTALRVASFGIWHGIKNSCFFFIYLPTESGGHLNRTLSCWG